jgi:hypothetical protein
MRETGDEANLIGNSLANETDHDERVMIREEW